jgi:hypothetical protein
MYASLSKMEDLASLASHGNSLATTNSSEVFVFGQVIHPHNANKGIVLSCWGLFQVLSKVASLAILLKITMSQ